MLDINIQHESMYVLLCVDIASIQSPCVRRRANNQTSPGGGNLSPTHRPLLQHMSIAKKDKIENWHRKGNLNHLMQFYLHLWTLRMDTVQPSMQLT